MEVVDDTESTDMPGDSEFGEILSLTGSEVGILILTKSSISLIEGILEEVISIRLLLKEIFSNKLSLGSSEYEGKDA